ncbi:hypothetical protein EVAR_47762_1 [Eumeta japonica]|uniref:Uncharacterized protein n=1 Tax=Eumeta variegata TaxID=151549 RepID=A0A4C1XVU0_EUMVA|nr:hypothetical protein EVAR_47762_1 [Eumeta japonica]
MSFRAIRAWSSPSMDTRNPKGVTSGSIHRISVGGEWMKGESGYRGGSGLPELPFTERNEQRKMLFAARDRSNVPCAYPSGGIAVGPVIHHNVSNYLENDPNDFEGNF